MPIIQPLPIKGLIAELAELLALEAGQPVPYPASEVGVEVRLAALELELMRRIVKGDELAVQAAEILWK